MSLACRDRRHRAHHAWRKLAKRIRESLVLPLVLAMGATSWGQWRPELVTASPLVPQQPRSTDPIDARRAWTLAMQARVLLARDDAAGALRAYQRAWRLDRDARVLLKQIVPLALELGRVAEATRYATLLAEADLQDPFLAERIAMLLSDQLEYDRSLQLYQHVLKLRADSPAARDPIAMHFEMGRLYFLSGKYPQASQSFRVVLDALENPNRKVAPEVRQAILEKPDLTYQLIGESFLEAGQYADARALFTKALLHETNPDRLKLQLARVDYRQGNHAAARQRLEAYIREKFRFAGQTPYALLQSVLEHVEKDKPAPSGPLPRFRQWLADDPDNLDLLTFVADLTRRRGVLIDAAALYERLLQKQPSLETYQGLVGVYRQLKDGDKLLAVMGRVTGDLNSLEPFGEDVEAILEDRDFLKSLYRIGREKLKSDAVFGNGVRVACGLLALRAKHYAVADEFLGDLDRGHSDLYIAWGLELLMAERSERAAQVFEAALAREDVADTRAVLHYYLAGAHQLAGNTERALEAAAAAIELRGDMPDFALRPAWILFTADRLDEAEAAYRRWLKTHAEDYSLPGIRGTVREARVVMSAICSEQNRPAEAAEWLEQILDEYPSDPGVKNDLGYLLVSQNRSLVRATRMIREAVEAEPDNPAYRDSLGWALYQQGDFSGAVAQLQRAAHDDDSDPIILDHLGDALQALGKTEAALECWRQANGRLDGSPDEQLKAKIAQKLAAQSVE